MTESLIDIDDDLLRRAQELSGIRTTNDVITVALQEMVRRRSLERYTDFAAAAELGDLGDPQVIRSAQRGTVD